VWYVEGGSVPFPDFCLQIFGRLRFFSCSFPPGAEVIARKRGAVRCRRDSSQFCLCGLGRDTLVVDSLFSSCVLLYNPLCWMSKDCMRLHATMSTLFFPALFDFTPFYMPFSFPFFFPPSAAKPFSPAWRVCGKTVFICASFPVCVSVDCHCLFPPPPPFVASQLLPRLLLL